MEMAPIKLEVAKRFEEAGTRHLLPKVTLNGGLFTACLSGETK